MRKATISMKPGTTAYGRERKRLRAWLMEHNAHGLSYEVHFLEDGDKPEINEWIRAPWLDEPEGAIAFTSNGDGSITRDK